MNPLFGSDGLQPFLDDCGNYGAGIFVLVKTSNPGSADLQDLEVAEDGRFYEKVAALVDEWGQELIGETGYSSVGAVVGATHPEILADLRKQTAAARRFYCLDMAPRAPAPHDVAPAFDSRGLGALVTASRSIIYSGDGEDYATVACRSCRKHAGRYSGRRAQG